MNRRLSFFAALAIALVTAASVSFLRSPVADAASFPNVTIGTLATYRAAETVAVAISAGTGDICELRGVTGYVGRLKRIVIAKPVGAFVLTVVKRSSLDTGGTATSPAMVPMDSSFDAAASLTVKGYTAAPTKGATVGNIYVPMSIGTGDLLVVDFGNDDTQACAIRAGESVALVTDTATTISYMLLWTEDTR